MGVITVLNYWSGLQGDRILPREGAHWYSSHSTISKARAF